MATEKDLIICPGFSEQKSRRFREAMDACFDPLLWSKE